MIPKDPNILLSLVNTAMRDRGITPEDFAAEAGMTAEELKERLGGIGYEYREEAGRFLPVKQ